MLTKPNFLACILMLVYQRKEEQEVSLLFLGMKSFEWCSTTNG